VIGVDEGDARPSHGISFGDATLVWIYVALNSFGGPAGQIAVMHRVLVEEKRWISEARFLHALNYCMLLPGPEATQLATYVGWLLHGTRGGLVAGVLFVLPGFLSILALSLLYVIFQEAAPVEALFFGLKAAVLAVVVEAVVRIGRKALSNWVMAALAAVAFVGIFFLAVPFPFIVLGAGLAGLALSRLMPSVFRFQSAPTVGGTGFALGDEVGRQALPNAGRAWRTLATWLAIWFLPLVAITATGGFDSTFTRIGGFFSTAAVVTFGGAYSVLAYIAQQAVETYAWLEPGEMLDGLGLAETTPGPLIQVVQFVAFMGAFRQPEGLNPLLAGVLGSLLATWVTFVPCFLWIFLGAPYIEHLRGNKALAAALSAITAAVVGVILNLAVWFSLHVLFSRVDEVWRHGVRLYRPAAESLDVAALAITVAAFLALFRFRLGMIPTLVLGAAAGLAYRLLMSG
jgi:chromate transporter